MILPTKTRGSAPGRSKLWENHGNMMEIMGKKHGKTTRNGGFSWEIMGKIMEHHGENH